MEVLSDDPLRFGCQFSQVFSALAVGDTVVVIGSRPLKSSAFVCLLQELFNFLLNVNHGNASRRMPGEGKPASTCSDYRR
jgi:hypothetical protein